MLSFFPTKVEGCVAEGSGIATDKKSKVDGILSIETGDVHKPFFLSILQTLF